MIKYFFNVVLSSGSHEIYAFNEREAIILAQAEAIREGFSYEVISVEKLEDSNKGECKILKTINIIKCPHCNTEMEPWEYLDTGDMDGDFTLHCENPECEKEFNVSFTTDVIFLTSKIN